MIADLKVEALSLGISDSIISYNEYNVIPGTINIFLKDGKYDVYITSSRNQFDIEKTGLSESELKKYVMKELRLTNIAMQQFGEYREFNLYPEKVRGNISFFREV